MNIEQIDAALRSNRIAQHTIQQQMQAFKTLHDSSAFAKDGVEVAKYRAILFELLEKDLDLSATGMSLARARVELPG